MNKKILGIMFSLIIILSSIFVISILTENSTDSEYKDPQDYSSDDILNQLDESLLYEDGEIEIGEMV
jgi:hypothetical protein